jgi:hypothetical protein
MKTVADCFKYRSKIGMETVVAALGSSVRQGKYSRYRLLHSARICRVEKLIRGYLPGATKSDTRGS